jgi:hypothetical protein
MCVIVDVQETETEENEELDLFLCCHLQLKNNWKRKSKQDNFCNDLIDNRQFQYDKPVKAFCCLCGFEVPLGSDWIASDGCRKYKGNCETSCEGHKGKDSPLQPHVRKYAEI